MNIEEIKAALVDELQQAEQQLKAARLHYDRVKKAYMALENQSPEEKKSRENLQQLVLDALEDYGVSQNFTVRQLFDQMNRPDLVFENVRPRLVTWLHRLTKEGVLKQTGRGVFQREMRRFALYPKKETEDSE